MGDYPAKQMQSPLDHTDQIFGPATKHEELRDEIYGQIMKQMTSNNNRYAEKLFHYFRLSDLKLFKNICIYMTFKRGYSSHIYIYNILEW